MEQTVLLKKMNPSGNWNTGTRSDSLMEKTGTTITFSDDQE